MRISFKRWQAFGAIVAVVTALLVACAGPTPVTIQDTNTLSEMVFEPGDTDARSLDLTKYFETTRDTLKFSSRSSNSAVAKVTQSGTGNSQLTVTPGAAGKNDRSAEITVTASDGQDEISRKFTVTVKATPPPEIIATVRPTIEFDSAADDPVKITLKDYFSGAKSYSAKSSAPKVATATEDGGVVTITPKGSGNATVTVTATNDGGSRSQTIEVGVVTPAKAPPVINDTFTQVDFDHGDTDAKTFMLSKYFSGATSYDADSDAEAVAKASVAEGVLSITPVSSGTANVKVTATNDDGSRHQTIRVVVAGKPNQAPTVKKTLMNIRIVKDGNTTTTDTPPANGFYTLNLNEYFTDPEKAPLSYEVKITAGKDYVRISSRTIDSDGNSPGTAPVTPVTDLKGFGDKVTIDATEKTGTATIEVTATDNLAQSTVRTFDVRVVDVVSAPVVCTTATQPDVGYCGVTTVGGTGVAAPTIAGYTGNSRLKMSDAAKTVIDDEFSDYFWDADLQKAHGDVLTFSVKYVATSDTVNVNAADLAADKIVATATISPREWSGDAGGATKQKFKVVVTPKKAGAGHDILIVATDLSGNKAAVRIPVHVNQAPLAVGAQPKNPEVLSKLTALADLRASSTTTSYIIKAVDAYNADATDAVADNTYPKQVKLGGYFHDDDTADTLECEHKTDIGIGSSTEINTSVTNLQWDGDDHDLTISVLTSANTKPKAVMISVRCTDGVEYTAWQSFKVHLTRTNSVQ